MGRHDYLILLVVQQILLNRKCIGKASTSHRKEPGLKRTFSGKYSLIFFSDKLVTSLSLQMFG